MRGIGFILGGLLKMRFMRNIDLHRGLAGSCLSAGIASILFILSFNQLWLALTSLWIATSMCILDICINVCIIRKGEENVTRFILLGMISLGIGYMTGGMVVSLFGIKSCIGLGVGLICLASVFSVIPPFNEEQKEETGAKNIKITNEA